MRWGGGGGGGTNSYFICAISEFIPEKFNFYFLRIYTVILMFILGILS